MQNPNLEGAVNLSKTPEGELNPLVQAMQQAPIAPPTEQQTVHSNPNINPLVQRVKMPGKMFQLPSKGMLYQNGELNSTVENGEIHVRPMSAMAEITLKNADMLFSGKAYEEVISECCPDVNKPLELFSRDVDAIMTYIRMVTYGDDISYEYTHDCKDAKPHEYSINLNTLIAQIKPLDQTIFSELYKITLQNGQNVQLEPIRMGNLLHVFQTEQEDRVYSAQELQEQMITNTLYVINNVDGIYDKQQIGEWLRMLDAVSMNAIHDKINNSHAWGLDFTDEKQCPDCGKPVKLDIPTNPVSFFSN